MTYLSQSNLTIILVRPQFNGNLGSVARAMKNMGLSELCLVNPQADLSSDEAKKMAVHAGDVLASAKVYWDLDSALKGFQWVVGTSRRTGKERDNWMSPREFANSEFLQNVEQKTAILFGTEDTGLTNEELSKCQHLISIPSHEACPSLNLAQAVMVVCYELFQVRISKVPSLNTQKTSALSPRGREMERGGALAQFENLEAMYQDFGKLLQESGFLDKNNPEHILRLIRNLFNRAHLTEKEVKIIRGICRQIRWWAEQP